jgi:hypothetical protein
MKIFETQGSKERLYQMMKRVNKMDETPLPVVDKEGIIEKFIEFVQNHIDTDLSELEIIISYSPVEAAEQSSFGKYTPSIKELRVVSINRNLADVLRTLAHELVHYKQDINGELTSDSNGDGSPQENEANAVAAVIMREFGKIYPIIFE